MVVLLVNFLPWIIVLFLHNLEVHIGVLHVGAVWFLDVGIHVSYWGRTLALRSQRLLDGNISNQV